MPRRRPRHLSDEDRDLWDRVAAEVTPIDAARAPAKRFATPSGETAPRPPDARLHVPAIGSASREPVQTVDLAPNLQDRLSRGPSPVDANTHNRLRRGKVRPEARIDLHGMTLAQAHPVLIAFVQRAHAARKRLVLVITGKGRDRSGDVGVFGQRGLLRRQVPHWLQSGPLASMVLQISPAHIRHGGEGAYYVYLRRRR